MSGKYEDTLEEYRQRNAKAVAEDTATGDTNTEAKSPEEIHAALSAKHAKYKSDTLENIDKVYATFPLLKTAEDSAKNNVLDFVYWSLWHESIAVICHDDGIYKYAKVRQKFETIYDEDGKPSGKSTNRTKGKWSKGPSEKNYPFAFALFWENFDFGGDLIIGESEKNAINAYLKGIPYLTLGAASARWSEHLKLLKDDNGKPICKRIILWFDNDDAGRAGARAAADDLSPLGVEIMTVDWAKLDRFASAKSDPTDYIESRPHLSGDDIIKNLEAALVRPSSSLEWEDIRANLLSKVEPLKARNLEEVYLALDTYVKLLDPDLYDIFERDSKALEKKLTPEEQEALESEEDELKSAKEKASAKLKKLKAMYFIRTFFDRTAMVNLLKHTTSDAAKEIIDLFEHNKVWLKQYHGKLYFWCGTHYHELKGWELSDFLIDWMKAAKVNIKQSYNSKQFKDPISESIISLQKDLEGLMKKFEGISVINHQNGTLLIDEKGYIRQKSHDHNDGITYCLPFAYEPSAKAQKFQKFLDTSVPEKETQMILQEYVGYLFIRNYSAQEFLYLIGDGANGKSVFLEVVEKLFPKEQVSHVEVADMEDHNLDALDGKLVNVSSEIESGGYMSKQVALIKKIVVGEPIQINPKHEKSYVLYNPPKLLMSGNDLLKGGGLNDGLTRRMKIVPFDVKIPKEQRVADLATQIAATELPGVLNWALEGLQRLITRKYRFTESAKVNEAIEEYKQSNDHILSYVCQTFEYDDKNNIIKNLNNWVSTGLLYEHYRTWCKQVGHTPLAQNRFSTEVGKKLELKAEKKISNASRVFVGVSVVSEMEFQINENDAMGNKCLLTLTGRDINNRGRREIKL